jgi:hypothetical protein
VETTLATEQRQLGLDERGVEDLSLEHLGVGRDT